VSCSKLAPSDEVARQGLISLVDSGRSERLRLRSFSAGPRPAHYDHLSDAYVVPFVALGEFTSDGRYAGPSVLDDRIRTGPARGDSLWEIVGYPVRRGDELRLAGVLGLVHEKGIWVLVPALTEIQLSVGQVRH
jgi:hypothetical protein